LTGRGAFVVVLLSLAAAACTRCNDSWEGFAQQFFTRKCVRCHGAMADPARVARDRAVILGMLASKRMPPLHPRTGLLQALPQETVSPEERERIERYLSCGAPGTR